MPLNWRLVPDELEFIVKDSGSTVLVAGAEFAGAVTDRVVAVGDTIGVRPTMTLVTAFDHRALDGATAARFTSALRRFLQESR